LLELLKRDVKPLDIMTPKAFENGITTVMALGGSTNAVLHLLAMSRAAGCPLDLADFQRISDKTPFIADFKPSGKYLMEDLHKVCSSDSCRKKRKVYAFHQSSQLRSKRLRWFGHICRMADSRLPKVLMHGQLVGQNCRGRPRTVWNDFILFDIHKLKLNRYPSDALNKPV